MNLIDTGTEVKNSKLLFLLLGMLTIPTINAVDGLLTDVFRVTFPTLPLKSLLIVSITFHGLILLSLIYILITIMRQTRDEAPWVFFSIKTFQTIGVSFILIIVFSSALHSYVKTNLDTAINLKVYFGDTTNLAYMTFTQGVLILLRNIILFLTFFLIIKKQSR